MLQSTIAGSIDRHVGARFSQVQPGAKNTGLHLFALSLQTFYIAMQTPEIVVMLRGTYQRII
jgi:hypothetical protein